MLEQAKNILGQLVAFPTVSTDSNLAIVHYITGLLEACGARVTIDHDPTGRKANLFATLGPDVDGGLVLSGHTDVVPVTDQNWSTDPFAMVERDGRLYGRGTCDMKGFLAAVLAMAPKFAKTRRSKPIHFAFTYDEETGCLGAQHLARSLSERGCCPAMAIVGEPTQMRIIEGHKGCYEYTTRFRGLEGHGSAPDQGVNAVEFAARYVTRLLELREALKTRTPERSPFEPPWATLNIGAVHGGSVHNVIAAKAQVDWEMRPVHPYDACFVKEAISAYCDDTLLPAMRAIYPAATIETEIIGEVAAFEPTKENSTKTFLSALTGANSADLVPFGTEAGIFQALGMDVVVCGPGSIEQAHKADEFLTVDQLERCLNLLRKIDLAFV
jgi:acetylornithine deacetylase